MDRASQPPGRGRIQLAVDASCAHSGPGRQRTRWHWRQCGWRTLVRVPVAGLKTRSGDGGRPSKAAAIGEKKMGFKLQTVARGQSRRARACAWHCHSGWQNTGRKPPGTGTPPPGPPGPRFPVPAESGHGPFPDSRFRPIGNRESGNPPKKRENGGSDSRIPSDVRASTAVDSEYSTQPRREYCIMPVPLSQAALASGSY